MKFPNIYATPRYKYYILISIALAILAVMTLPGLKYSIDLQGGTQLMVIVDEHMPQAEIASALGRYNLEDLNIRYTENPLTGRRGVIIEFTGTADLIRAESLISSSPEEAIALASPFVQGNLTPAMTAREVVELAKADFTKQLHNEVVTLFNVPEDRINTVEIGASLGREFWETSQRAMIVAIFLIALIVFILFRELVPSIVVLHAAFYDVLFALAGMSLFGIPLSLATIAGLLMILGHSVDTDILTTDRILKRKEGTTAERAHGAMLTGLTITGTLIAVLSVIVIFSHLNQMEVLFQIAAVILFGMIGDLVSTYFTTTVVTKWWADRKRL